jgi:hypothetical protein
MFAAIQTAQRNVKEEFHRVDFEQALRKKIVGGAVQLLVDLYSLPGASARIGPWRNITIW